MELYDILSNTPTLDDVIPESCLSFSDQALFVAEFAHNEYNMMMQFIAMNELAVFESTNEDIVYEGEEAEKLGSKVSKFISRSFGAMKAFFGNVNTAFTAKIANGKKVMDKVNNGAVANLPEDFSATTHAFFDPTKIKFADNAAKFCKEVDKTFMALAKKDASSEEAKTAMNALVDRVLGSVLGINQTRFKSTKEFKTFLKNELTGSEVKVNKAWLKKNISKVSNIVAGEQIPSAVKEAYKDQKKMLDECYRTVANHQTDPAYSKVLQLWLATIAEATTVALLGYGVAFDVYKRMHKEYTSIAVKASKYANKPVKEDASEGPIEDKCDTGRREGDIKDNSAPAEGTVKDADDKLVGSPEGMKSEVPGSGNSEESKAHDVTKDIEDAIKEDSVEEGLLSNVGKKMANSSFGKAGLKVGQEIQKKKAAKEEKELKESAEYNLIDKAFDF